MPDQTPTSGRGTALHQPPIGTLYEETVASPPSWSYPISQLLPVIQNLNKNPSYGRKGVGKKTACNEILIYSHSKKQLSMYLLQVKIKFMS